MTYQASEAAKRGGKPVEVYRFSGTYDVYRYTSHSEPVTFQAPDEEQEHTYQPIAINRGAVNIVTSEDSDSSELEVSIPVGAELVIVYGFQIAPPELKLTVWRFHKSEEPVRYWHGHVENISVARGTATIRVPSQFASALSGDFPNVYFQMGCNHTLFDKRCGVPVEDWSITTEIVALNGKQVTVATVGQLGGQLLGGDLVLPSGERRMISIENGNILTINYPFAGASIGDECILMTGCDLAWKGDCKNRYDNTLNFGGDPFIPNKNVFSNGLEPGKDVAGGEPCVTPCDKAATSFEVRVVGTTWGGDTGIRGRPYLGDRLHGYFGQTGPYKFVCGDPEWGNARVSYYKVNVPPADDFIYNQRQGGGTSDCPGVGGAYLGAFKMYIKGDSWPEFRLCPATRVGWGRQLDAATLELESGNFDDTGAWHIYPDFSDPRYLG